MLEANEHYHTILDILGDLDNDELNELLVLTEKEIRLSKTAIKEGFERGKR